MARATSGLPARREDRGVGPPDGPDGRSRDVRGAAGRRPQGGREPASGGGEEPAGGCGYGTRSLVTDSAWRS